MRQRDLFDDHEQGDLLASERPPVVYRADPDKVRAKLRALVEEARAASRLPWDAEELRYHLTVVPQMSRWLPDEEAAQIRREFDAEIARLTAA
jgi:hypothetical protein